MSKTGDVPICLRGIGTVQALNSVEVHPQVGGVLIDVPVREGQDVRKGDTLAVIDPRPYKAALDKAQAQRQQDQAQLDNSRADLTRYSSLARSDFASRQQVETQQSTVARFQGVIAADDAAIEDAQLNLGFCVLHASMDGRVGLRRVDPGNLIQANSTGPGIFSVVQIRPIALVFTLPFDAMLRFYERTLDIALWFQFVTLLVFLITVASTVGLFIIIPKGFFPVQDTGIIIGITDAAQDVSFQGMQRLQQRVNALVGQDPGGRRRHVVGRRRQRRADGEQRADVYHAEALSRAQRERHPDRGAAQPEDAGRWGDLFMQPTQDVGVGGRLSRTQYQYTLSDPNGDELNTWAPQVLDKLRSLPGLADVTSDAAGAGLTATLTYDKDEAARFGVQPGMIDATLDDAFGQRQVTQYFTNLKAYYVILEVTPGQQGTLDTLRQLYVRTASGGTVPLSTFVRIDTAPVQPLVVNHQSQFPSVTISYNLKPGTALGDSVTAIQQATAAMGVPSTVTGAFQGTAQAFQSSLSSQPLLILAALVAVYIILGILYESYILPLTILSTLRSPGWERC